MCRGRVQLRSKLSCIKILFHLSEFIDPLKIAFGENINANVRLKMSIYYLSADEFSVENGRLAIALPGTALVMYTTKTCMHCIKFIPEYKMLPKRMTGITIAICDLDDNRGISRMSQTTLTPIDKVPKIILYVNGLPKAVYSGVRNNNEIIKFIQEVMSTLTQRQAVDPRVQAHPNQHAQPQQPMQHAIPMHQQPQQQFPQQQAGPQSAFPAPPRHAQHPSTGGGGGQSEGNRFRIVPTTGVKEYDASYGRPYNTANEADYLESLAAYQK